MQAGNYGSNTASSILSPNVTADLKQYWEY